MVWAYPLPYTIHFAKSNTLAALNSPEVYQLKRSSDERIGNLVSH